MIALVLGVIVVELTVMVEWLMLVVLVDDGGVGSGGG